MARPVRLARGKQIDATWRVQPELFELEEERALWVAYQAAAAQVGGVGGVGRQGAGGNLSWAPLTASGAASAPAPPCLAPTLNRGVCPTPIPPPQVSADMPVAGFLSAAEPLIAPLDAYFDKVFVMCDDEVRLDWFVVGDLIRGVLVCL